MVWSIRRPRLREGVWGVLSEVKLDQEPPDMGVKRSRMKFRHRSFIEKVLRESQPGYLGNGIRIGLCSSELHNSIRGKDLVYFRKQNGPAYYMTIHRGTSQGMGAGEHMVHIGELSLHRPTWNLGTPPLQMSAFLNKTCYETTIIHAVSIVSAWGGRW